MMYHTMRVRKQPDKGYHRNVAAVGFENSPKFPEPKKFPKILQNLKET